MPTPAPATIKILSISEKPNTVPNSTERYFKVSISIKTNISEEILTNVGVYSESYATVPFDLKNILISFSRSIQLGLENFH